MSKPKHGKPEEFHLGQIRELKKENKSLRQKLKLLEKREHLAENSIDLDDEETKEIEPKQKKCQECAKGTLVFLELRDKLFSTCNLCGNRKKHR